jgi:hypothetical protein
MIIARATKDTGEEMIILGLTMVNLRRLAGGEPIICKRETHGDGIPQGWQISIIVGETEESIYEQFKKAGLIRPQTQVIKDPRLGASDKT